MYRLAYVSSAVNLFSEPQLEKLLVISRGNNIVLGITGMLLYKDGNFMQLIEGEEAVVLGLIEKIKSDPRHRRVIILIQEQREKRDFDHWSMGFKKLDATTAMEVPGYNDFFNVPLTSEKFQIDPTESMRLLLTFRQATE